MIVSKRGNIVISHPKIQDNIMINKASYSEISTLYIFLIFSLKKFVDIRIYWL